MERSESMIVEMNISGVSEAEKAAKEILEHIEAIKELQKTAAYKGIRITIDMKDETASWK